MKIKPNYYADFHCIGSACKHSCCKLWELGVDDETFEYYGEYYPKLLKTVETDDDEIYYQFKQDKNRNCVNLRKDGLCDIMCRYGESTLPEYCQKHPRFLNYQGDRTEYGLGICCEEACGLVLDTHKKFALSSLMKTDIHDEDDYELTDEDRDDPDFMEFIADCKAAREFRNGYIKIFNDDGKPFLACMEEAKLRFIDPKKCFEVLSPLERLDKSWTRNLEYLKVASSDVDISEFDYIFRNLAIYFLYRHTEDIVDCVNGMEVAEEDFLHFVEFSLSAIYGITQGIKKSTKKLEKRTLLEICREYSAEIEYSTENVELIIEHYTDIKGEDHENT